MNQLNRGEDRHKLARAVFHGRRGELRQRYHEGQEDQLIVGQLFPWLASGQDNRIPPNAAFRDMIRLKTMHQDFLSLSRLYARIAAAGAKFTIEGVPADFKRISDTFAHGASVIADFLIASPPGAESKVRASIDDRIKHLGAEAGAIHKTWDKVACLRECELGAGMLFKTKSTNWKWCTIGSITNHKGPNYGNLNAVPTAFDPEVGNFDVFSQAVKCWPFILPDGRIAVFVCDGDKENSGILAGWYSAPIGAVTTMEAPIDPVEFPEQRNDPQDPQYDMGVDYFTQGDRRPLIFEERGSTLRGYTMSSQPDERHNGRKTTVDIHPIPFTAAKGIDWKGSAVTTGMGTLPQTLEDLRDQLSKVNSWSLDSEHWAGKNLKEFRYRMQMGPSYIGLVDEPPNVFGK